MTVLALDWNATRLRAVAGPAGDYPLPVPLEPPRLDLPLAISLEKRLPELGSAALGLCRRVPEQVCQAFLPHLTATPGQGPRWKSGRHSLDPRQACELVWRKVQPLSANMHGILLTVPGYLLPAQAEALRQLGEAARLPVLGSLPATLAAALAGHAEVFWLRSVLVIDVDDHAVTIGWVKASGAKAKLVESRTFPHLGLRFWRERLINTLADLFVWQHRLDPRDAPWAEQCLYDQLDALTDAAQRHQAIQLGVQGQHWFKHLLVHPEQTVQFCQPLVRKVVHEAGLILQGWPTGEWPRTILLTHQAGRLPGLVAELQTLVRPHQAMNETKLPQTKETAFDEDDFGDELVFLHDDELGSVIVLAAEAPARAAHGLAEFFQTGKVAPGHLETSAPLAPPPSVEAGPPRLHFLGRDYLLHEDAFVLGSQFGSHLLFERNDYPAVAARHCEIIADRRGFTLHNRSRAGTLVNDQPLAGPAPLYAGDRIRLGQEGPTVRFLGNRLPFSARLVPAER